MTEEEINQQEQDMNMSAEEYEKVEELRRILGDEAPAPEDKQSMFSLFKHIIKTKDSTKVGNLDKEELRSVRELKFINNYADKMGLNEVSRYITCDAESILGTSLSNKAALLNAIITSKKEAKFGQKQVQGGKSGWIFGKKDNNQNEET